MVQSVRCVPLIIKDQVRVISQANWLDDGFVVVVVCFGSFQNKYTRKPHVHTKLNRRTQFSPYTRLSSFKYTPNLSYIFFNIIRFSLIEHKYIDKTKQTFTKATVKCFVGNTKSTSTILQQFNPGLIVLFSVDKIDFVMNENRIDTKVKFNRFHSSGLNDDQTNRRRKRKIKFLLSKFKWLKLESNAK